VVEVGVDFFNQTLSGGPGARSVHVRDPAEAGGCSMFTCMNDYFQVEGFTRAGDPMLEGYTTLGVGERSASNTDVYVMNADGSGQRRLTHAPRDDLVPA
jgi:hypothetical protein